MIKDHEIPSGSKLYFAQAAKQKRLIETKASAILSEAGFEEIVTPLFSYQQHQSIEDDKMLVRLSDTENNNMSLRADSTIDVVRIIQKRLGRNTEHKKWFYVQAIYKYPSIEQYQVGAEFIDETDLSYVLNEAIAIMNALEVSPLLQLSNINIAKRVVESVEGLELDDFKHVNVDKMLSLNIDWLTKLVYLQHEKDIDSVIAIVPDVLKVELIKLQELLQKIEYKNVVVAPLYYAQMLYYDELFFRMIDKNDVYALGGRYKSDDMDETIISTGFAIYTDTLIEVKKDK